MEVKLRDLRLLVRGEEKLLLDRNCDRCLLALSDDADADADADADGAGLGVDADADGASGNCGNSALDRCDGPVRFFFLLLPKNRGGGLPWSLLLFGLLAVPARLRPS